MSEKVILTEEGKQELEKKLEYLKLVKRPEIVNRIKIAREQGDLSENAEYDAARNEQSLLEGEIQEIEAKLKVAEIITVSGKRDFVYVGSKVVFTDLSRDKKFSFEIVGTTEADFKAGRISNESPIGRALLGRKVGDIAVVEAPSGNYQIRVEEVNI